MIKVTNSQLQRALQQISRDDAQPKAPAPAAEKKPHQPKLLDRNFGVATFRYNRWAADLDPAETLDHALQPAYWAHQAAKIMGADKLKPKGIGDIIEVRQRSTGLYAELLVTEIGAGFIKVKLIRQEQPDAVELPQGLPFTIAWNEGRKHHEVLRVADRQRMAGEFQTRAAAAEWIVSHMTAMMTPAPVAAPAALPVNPAPSAEEIVAAEAAEAPAKAAEEEKIKAAEKPAATEKPAGKKAG